MFITYVIKNEENKIYIGQTANLDKRLKRHNDLLTNRKTSYTSKNKSNWKLVYTEKFNTRKEAMKREKQLKSYQGRLFVKNIIASSISSVGSPPAGGLNQTVADN
jgi:putative endonuclease